MGLKEKALKFHKKNPPGNGKIQVISKVPIKTREDLSLAYTPGVAEVCRKIAREKNAKDKKLVYEYTSKGNMVAVVTDGTRVLGLGDIGPEAGMPVMEGKAILFKCFGGVDAFPICLDTKDPEEIIKTVKYISPGFGGINLEDISQPKCFYIEDRLKEELDIPVFHDDQHGTAVVTLAALYSALKVVEKNIEDAKIVFAGAGASGIACAKMMLNAGARNIMLTDSRGTLYAGREHMNVYKQKIAERTNQENLTGSLEEVLKDADVFVGLSARPGLLTKKMMKTMNKDPIIFALSNPVPEINPDDANAVCEEKGWNLVIATGRSDYKKYPNQINNVLGFPGIFRGALDVRAKCINEEMKISASKALQKIVESDGITSNYIIPEALDIRVVPTVAEYVAREAQKTSVARKPRLKNWVFKNAKKLVALNEELMEQALKVANNYR